jgi:hypothetical protein
MPIFASCGHAVESVDDFVHVEYDSEDIDHDAGCFVPVLVTGVYCPACAEEGMRAGWLRPHSYEQSEKGEN